MADLHEYNFSVIEDKGSSGQKRNLSLRHPLPSLSLAAVVLPDLYNFVHRQ